MLIIVISKIPTHLSNPTQMRTHHQLYVHSKYDNILLQMIDEYPHIPKEAFLYFPKDEETYQIRDRKPYRFIFEGGIQYTPYEKQKLAQLHEEIKKQPKSTHLAFVSQSTLLRFLQATKYDYQDCIKQLKKYKKWQDMNLPLRLKPQIQDLLKKGLFYITGRDTSFRPIIVVNVARIIDLDLKEKTFCEVAGFFFSYIIQNCMIEGQVEKWISIIDLGKIGMFSLGSTVVDIIGFLSKNFRCRLHHSYIVNCPSSIRFLFGMAKSAMTEDQISKLSLQEETQIPETEFGTIQRDQIQIKYGGTGENKTQFWPLNIKQIILTPQQKSKLITLEEYSEMHSKGLLKKKKICKSLLKQSLELHSLKSIQGAQTYKMIGEQSPRQLTQECFQNSFDESKYIEDSPPIIGNIPMPIDFSFIYQ